MANNVLTGLVGQLHIWMCKPRAFTHCSCQGIFIYALILPIFRWHRWHRVAIITVLASNKRVSLKVWKSCGSVRKGMEVLGHSKLTLWCWLAGVWYRQHTSCFKVCMSRCQLRQALVSLKNLTKGVVFVWAPPRFLDCCDVPWFGDWCA